MKNLLADPDRSVALWRLALLGLAAFFLAAIALPVAVFLLHPSPDTSPQTAAISGFWGPWILPGLYFWWAWASVLVRASRADESRAGGFTLVMRAGLLAPVLSFLVAWALFQING
ncbi:hypothetical protein [Pseudogemmobacter bohemicus]|uniref:hypothetical protein n=1 Tax=Pseudogemmobacter bohemicus TaxID=2250708 RepID=UPI000DD4D1A4|nr:hypothetical protein [Pseudogemmobacter bohemicus]